MSYAIKTNNIYFQNLEKVQAEESILKPFCSNAIWAGSIAKSSWYRKKIKTLTHYTKKIKKYILSHYI